jgi:hypothetical protein
MSLEPNIDFTEEFRFLGQYTLSSGEYGGNYSVNIPFRSDACLVQVQMLAGGENWHKAGYVRQLWNSGLSEYPTVLTARRVWLRQVNLVVLEQVEQSTISFTAVQWLHTWEVKIWARQSVNTRTTIEDILLTIVGKEDEVLDRLDELETLIRDGVEVGSGVVAKNIAAAKFIGLI